MPVSSCARVAALCAAGLAAAVAAAQPAPTAAVPIERAEAEPPLNRFGMPLEGWVKLRYIVLEDGTTDDIRVVERMPATLPTRSAEVAVRRWTFAPATHDGEPIASYNHETTIVFDDENVPLEPSPMFTRAYLGVVELLGEPDYKKALSTNRSIRTSRLNEIGLAEMQAASAMMGLGDVHGAYEAILRATDPDAVTLGPAELAQALMFRFALEIQLGRAVDALATHERRAALETIAADDPLAQQAAALAQALRGDGVLAIKGRVDRDPWKHVPSRRTFALGDIDGTVRAIEVECDRRRTELEFQQDVEWTLPESWGSCTLLVDARRDTSFVLYEFK